MTMPDNWTLHPITVVIADDHPIFRTGLKDVLRREQRIRLLADACDGAEALSRCRELLPQVVILDIEMPVMSGIEVAKTLYEEDSPVRCMILSMYQEDAIFNKAIDCGVTGYLLKDSAATDIVKAVFAVAKGEYFFSPALTHLAMRQGHHAGTGEIAGAVLSPMEQKVLRLVAESRSTKEIAHELCISLRTVDNHRLHICKKLGLNGSYSLLRYALDHKEIVRNI